MVEYIDSFINFRYPGNILKSHGTFYSSIWNSSSVHKMLVNNVQVLLWTGRYYNGVLLALTGVSGGIYKEPSVPVVSFT